MEEAVGSFLRFICLVAYSAFLATSLHAQGTFPPGTVIPVVLRKSIDSKTSNPGQQIVAEVAQDVPTGPKVQIRLGTKLLGEIVRVESTSSHTAMTLRFDRLEVDHKEIPVRTQLRAIADFTSIEYAQRPETPALGGGTDSPASWTTTQIGGDVVYRGGGPVESASGEKVGTPTPCVVVAQCGVLDMVQSAPPTPNCAGAIADSTRPQAMWVFSADACGVYGFANLQYLNREDRSSAEIVFSSDKRIQLRKFTGLLLTASVATAD